jgi:hypothetical protein
MPTRPSKKKIDELEDINSLAARIVAQATGQPKTADGKNPAAVALGKLGASKGGKARAEKLSARRRKEIARAAAIVRWMPNPSEGEGSQPSREG